MLQDWFTSIGFSKLESSMFAVWHHHQWYEGGKVSWQRFLMSEKMKQCLPQNLQKEFLKLKARSLCTSLGTRQPHTERWLQAVHLWGRILLGSECFDIRPISWGWLRRRNSFGMCNSCRPCMSVVIDKTEQQGLAAAYCHHYSCTSSSWFSPKPSYPRLESRWSVGSKGIQLGPSWLTIASWACELSRIRQTDGLDFTSGQS